MANFTKILGMNLGCANGLFDTKVTSTLPKEAYTAVETVLEKAKLSIKYASLRIGVPEDKIVLGEGTNKSYKRAKVYLKRATKATACIETLAPMDTADVVAFKSKLAALKFEGELPTSISIQYMNA